MAENKINPQHYKNKGIECIEIIEAMGLIKGFCLGNCIKYIYRHEDKGTPIEDLRKSEWYLRRYIKHLESTVVAAAFRKIPDKVDFSINQAFDIKEDRSLDEELRNIANRYNLPVGVLPIEGVGEIKQFKPRAADKSRSAKGFDCHCPLKPTAQCHQCDDHGRCLYDTPATTSGEGLCSESDKETSEAPKES